MSALELYRDDGPWARLVGATLGRAVRLPPIVLVVAGAAPLLAAIAIEGGGAGDGLAGLCLAWLILMGGISSGRPHTDRLRWAVVPVLRLAEYAAVIWIGALAGGAAPASAFALLAVVAFRHYDLVYRLRYQGVAPPRWVGDLTDGWEGRLALGWLLLALGWLPAGFYALAGLFAVVLTTESAVSWSRVQRGRGPVVYEDEEAGEE
jgi:Family of unknown function (DUF5941)